MILESVNSNNYQTFGSLQVGNYFISDRMLYIKTQHDEALRLSTDTGTYNFTDDQEIKYVQIEKIIFKYI